MGVAPSHLPDSGQIFPLVLPKFIHFTPAPRLAFAGLWVATCHPFPMLQLEGPCQNANLIMFLPAENPPQGKVQRTGLAFKALHSSAPAHLSSLLLTLSLPHRYFQTFRITHPCAQALPSVWNALAAACFVSPRTLLLILQGPAQRPLLQADFPDILGIVVFSSLAQP